MTAYMCIVAFHIGVYKYNLPTVITLNHMYFFFKDLTVAHSTQTHHTNIIHVLSTNSKKKEKKKEKEFSILEESRG